MAAPMVLPLGSDEWLEHVFSTPPVDRLKGRTLYTQAHQPWDARTGRHIVLQGRNEYIPYLILTYLQTLGTITRFKAHPFATSITDLGWEIRPDFIAQDAWQNRFVIEAKTARFITGEVELQLKANREGLQKFNLQYLLWTNWSPMTHPVRHNLINMRRAAAEEVTVAEIDRLVELATKTNDVTVEEAVAMGIDANAMFNAWWKGRIFLPLTQEMNLNSPIRLKATENLREIFLSSAPLRDDWWHSLPASKADSGNQQCA